MGSLVTTLTMIGSIVLVTVLVTGVRSQYASYGPVDLEAVDPLSLSWNQVHWLVKNQIKEVEELKAEHDEIYNEIAGCYGLEKCLTEFDLVDIKPGTKLWNLGLRKVDLSMSELSKQRDEVEQMRVVLNAQMKERHMEMIKQEELRIQELQGQRQELMRQEEIEQKKLEAAKALLEESEQMTYNSGGFSESSSSFSRSSSSSSSSARGQPFFGQTPFGSSSNFFSNQSTVFGPKPEVFDRSYSYSRSRTSSSSSRSRGYQG